MFQKWYVVLSKIRYCQIYNRGFPWANILWKDGVMLQYRSITERSLYLLFLRYGTFHSAPHVLLAAPAFPLYIYIRRSDEENSITMLSWATVGKHSVSKTANESSVIPYIYPVNDYLSRSRPIQWNPVCVLITPSAGPPRQKLDPSIWVFTLWFYNVEA